jgi:hypothetical protein
MLPPVIGCYPLLNGRDGHTHLRAALPAVDGSLLPDRPAAGRTLPEQFGAAVFAEVPLQIVRFIGAFGANGIGHKPSPSRSSFQNGFYQVMGRESSIIFPRRRLTFRLDSTTGCFLCLDVSYAYHTGGDLHNRGRDDFGGLLAGPVGARGAYQAASREGENG